MKKKRVVKPRFTKDDLLHFVKTVINLIADKACGEVSDNDFSLRLSIEIDMFYTKYGRKPKEDDK